MTTLQDYATPLTTISRAIALLLRPTFTYLCSLVRRDQRQRFSVQTVMSFEDPYSWTVSELIAQTCHSFALFQAVGCTDESYPIRTKLEHHLRSQGITGSKFLKIRDAQDLRSTLNVNYPHEQATLMSLIMMLRDRSPLYKEHATAARMESLQLRRPSQGSVITPSSVPGDAFIPGNDNHRRVETTHHANKLAPPPPDSNVASIEEQQWDYLLKWQHSDGDYELELASLGEGEDREEYDGVDAIEEDDEGLIEDAEEPKLDNRLPGRNKVSQDQIVDVINERIKYFTDTWTPNKGIPREEEVLYDVESMWTEAEEAGQRTQLIAKHEADLVYLRARLDSLCEEILYCPHANMTSVRHRCNNLEVTINSMELAEWLLSIYKLEPESESESEDQDAPGYDHHDGQNIANPHAGVVPGPREIPVEIFDLGSPQSSYSKDDRDSLVSVHSPINIAENTPEAEATSHNFRTPNRHVVQTIETSNLARRETYSRDHTLRSASVSTNNDEPERASIATVRRWKWADLIDTQDRKRVVSKAVYELDIEDREMIRNRLGVVGAGSMQKEMHTCIGMMSRGEHKMQGVLPRDLPKVITFTSLFLSWWLCENCVEIKPESWRLKELADCLQDGSPDPGRFCDYLSMIMTTTYSQEALLYPNRPSQAEIIEISDDEDNMKPSSETVEQHGNAWNGAKGSQHDVIMID